MANLTELKVNWKEQKNILKQRFALLTEDGLMSDEGKKEAMIEKLQSKFGKSKEQIKAIISSLSLL
jgi:uncharacterized protein YjbJ (UPF0337 family)